MVFRIVVVLTLLLVACGSDADGNAEITERSTSILHLHGSDISEADFKSGLEQGDPQTKAAFCYLASQGQEAFVNNAIQSEERLERQTVPTPTPSANETPVPGQKLDRDSAVRVYGIVKELCAN